MGSSRFRSTRTYVRNVTGGLHQRASSWTARTTNGDRRLLCRNSDALPPCRGRGRSLRSPRRRGVRAHVRCGGRLVAWTRIPLPPLILAAAAWMFLPRQREEDLLTAQWAILVIGVASCARTRSEHRGFDRITRTTLASTAWTMTVAVGFAAWLLFSGGALSRTPRVLLAPIALGIAASIVVTLRDGRIQAWTAKPARGRFLAGQLRR
jgi:hypothetical protein